MIAFYLDPKSGVAPYQQLVQQVKQGLRLRLLVVGDQLPTVREVVAQLTINPNTVLKAYRELENEGLVGGRPGQGTFVLHDLPGLPAAELATLRRGLLRWLESTRAAGLDDDGIQALFAATFQQTVKEDIA